MRIVTVIGRRSVRQASAAAFTLALVATPAGAQERLPEGPPATRAESVDLALHRRADVALWTGVRFGAFVPYGSLYAGRNLTTTPFQDVATGGPALEFDIGVQFARRFVGYGFFEHAWLGRGVSAAWTNPHDGQLGASTQALGVGLRWISNPKSFAFVGDVGLSYRWFSARWGDATTLRMQGFGDVRVGLGANWRIARHAALVPMLTVYTGAFSDRMLDGAPLGASTSSYVAAALNLGAYVDL